MAGTLRGRFHDRLAVDADPGFPGVYRRHYSIRGDDNIGDHVREVLCLTRSEATAHFGKLHISSTDVVEYGEAADGLLRLLRSCIEQRSNVKRHSELIPWRQ